ncbi:MAG: ABC transporter permease [Gemmatimonadetes bacterium]|nr:ABC transporter permease [Gemmatimonadota bacterium]
MLPTIHAAWRGLLGRSRLFTVSVVATLGVGIALTSATGVIARAIAFGGLPVPGASEVVVLWGSDRAKSFTHLPLRPVDIGPLATAMKGVATVVAGDYNGAYDWTFTPPSGSATPIRMRGTLTGGTFFQVLGVRALLGRTLRADDDVVGASRVIVLSERAWRTSFGGDSGVIGRALYEPRFGASYTVVGVVPTGLDYPRGVDFWSAFAPTAAVNGSLAQSPWSIDVVARLATGATPEQARQVVEAYYSALARQGQEVYDGAHATVRTLPDLVSGDVQPIFGAFAGAALLVLLVTCGNVISLFLVRASLQQRELAVRTALGAGRRRLARHLLGEVGVLAALGGLLGVVGSVAVLRLFVALAPTTIPRLDQVTPDVTLLAAVLVTCGVVVALVGLAPVLVVARTDPSTVLGNAREGVGTHAAHVRVRRLVVSAQVAMALVVLLGAMHGVGSLSRQRALDLGLSQPDALAFAELTFPHAGEVPRNQEGAALEKYRSTMESILERVKAAPGVTGVAPITATPFAGPAGWDGRLTPVDAAPEDTTRRAYLNMEVTNADYLAVAGLPLRGGRWIEAGDRESVPRVVVLSEGGARLLFPGRDAVGQRVALWAGLTATVVGVVGDTRFREFLVPRPTVYFPFRQFDNATLFLAVRTAMEPALAAGVVRQAVAEVNPGILVHDAGTMTRFMDRALARPRLLAAVLSAYGVVIILLAITGLYAVMAGGVVARRREFGVRAALGATPRRLHAMVLKEGLGVVLPGVVAGLFISTSLARWAASLFHGVDVTGMVTPVAAAGCLLGVCVLATSIPAWRAARADPARELRAD